jgi:protein arginine N-methyltransferase 7
LQYLERAVGVSKGKKVTLLAKRVEDRVTFSLREGVGVMVSKSPWKIVLGGGASTESPHYQRVHYCELLVRDFLMRLRGKRFPPIEKDMAMILAHCGNLYLEPRCLQDVYHDFCVTEMVFQNHWQEFSPGAMYGAVSSRPLYLA